MTRTQVRLECLRLCHRHDRSPAENVATAKILEAYVVEASDEPVKETESAGPQEKKVSRGRPPGKKTDNADILS